MEQQLVTGIAHDKNEARVTLTGLPDKPGTVAAIFAPLAKANINVDMIVQSGAGMGGTSTLTFTVPNASLAHAVAELEKARDAIGFDQILTDTEEGPAPPDAVTRIDVALALWRIDPEAPQAIPALVQALEGRNSGFRSLAARALVLVTSCVRTA